MFDYEEILLESYFCFKSALSEKGKFKINLKTKEKVQYLKENYELEIDDLLHSLFLHYVKRKAYKKYDVKKGALSTFIAHYVDNYMNNLIRKFDTLRENVPVYYDLTRNSLSNQNKFAMSFEEWIGVQGVAEFNTPESLLLAKELLELLIDHFGKYNSSVLLGYGDRRSASEDMGIDYYTYCKRLQRELKTFIQVLEDADYC